MSVFMRPWGPFKSVRQQFDSVHFPFLDGDIPRTTSYGVYISQVIRFAKVSSYLAEFNARNKGLTAKLLQ